jgi:hypothetical protein
LGRVAPSPLPLLPRSGAAAASSSGASAPVPSTRSDKSSPAHSESDSRSTSKSTWLLLLLTVPAGKGCSAWVSDGAYSRTYFRPTTCQRRVRARRAVRRLGGWAAGNGERGLIQIPQGLPTIACCNKVGMSDPPTVRQYLTSGTQRRQHMHGYVEMLCVLGCPVGACPGRAPGRAPAPASCGAGPCAAAWWCPPGPATR